MLSNVTNAVNRMRRNVVMNHPNAYNCELYSRALQRTAPEEIGGIPTLGGASVMSSEDEENISYSWLSDGYAMKAELFASAPMMDRGDAHNRIGNEFRFLVELNDGSAQIKKRDVMYLLVGGTVTPARLAFEIVGIETPLDIPPFTTVYIANRRDDLHVPVGG